MSSLDSLYRQRKQKRKELDTYKKRKDQAQKINRSVNKDFDDNIVASIKSNKESGELLGLSIQGDINTIEVLRTDIDGLKEKYIWNDGNMYNVTSGLENEVYRCQQEIDRLENELRRIDRQIEAALEAESEDE